MGHLVQISRYQILVINMYYVYILISLKDRNLYTGSTNDLRRRLEEHNSGQVFATKTRRPFNLIYYEACVIEKDARLRERYLKTSWGKRYIKSRLKSYFQEINKLSNGAGPKVQLNMEEGSGTSANDTSGNSNNGTVNSSTWTPLDRRIK